MPLPLPLAATPALLLLAASPMPADVVLPSSPFLDSAAAAAEAQQGGAFVQVETFDPIARARLIAEQMPRQWSGSYQSFIFSPAVPVQLAIDAVRPIGQMVDLRGRMTIGDRETPVQGNLNAKSDQLDLLLLGDEPIEGLELGGEFQGLQGLSLSGWHAPRLTSPGGRLQLVPQAAAPQPPSQPGAPVRGLW